MVPRIYLYASSEEQDGVITGTRSSNDKRFWRYICNRIPSGWRKPISFAVTVTDAPIYKAMILSM